MIGKRQHIKVALISVPRNFARGMMSAEAKADTLAILGGFSVAEPLQLIAAHKALRARPRAHKDQGQRRANGGRLRYHVISPTAMSCQQQQHTQPPRHARRQEHDRVRNDAPARGCLGLYALPYAIHNHPLTLVLRSHEVHALDQQAVHGPARSLNSRCPTSIPQPNFLLCELRDFQSTKVIVPPSK